MNNRANRETQNAVNSLDKAIAELETVNRTQAVMAQRENAGEEFSFNYGELADKTLYQLRKLKEARQALLDAIHH